MLGLTVHRLHGDQEAAEAYFDKALIRLPDSIRYEMADLSHILPESMGAAYSDKPGEEKYQSAETFWRFNDPLRLTTANEERTEYLSRFVEALLIFRRPELGLTMRDSEAGPLWLRYGRPDLWANTGCGYCL